VKGTGAKFTRWKQPIRIVARVSFDTKGEALRAEHALKKTTRAEKLRWCADPSRTITAT
jgi:putative endonuclease